MCNRVYERQYRGWGWMYYKFRYWWVYYTDKERYV